MAVEDDKVVTDGTAAEAAVSDADLFAEMAQAKADDKTVSPEGEAKPDAAAPAEGDDAAARAAADANKDKGAATLEVKDIPDLSKIDRGKLSPEEAAAIDAAAKVLHRERSDLGRQTALQRQVHTLKAENADLRAGKAAPAPAKDGEKPVPLRERPGVKKTLEDLPELGPVVDALEEINDRTSLNSEAIGGMTAEQRAAAYQREDDAFLAVHPDFKEHKDSGDFRNWVLSKPKSIQDIAKRHSGIVTDAAEAIELVNMFKLESGVPLKPAAKPAPKTGDGKAPVNNSSDKRKAQLDAARSTPAAAAPDTTGSAGSDDDALFRQMAEAKERKRA